MLVITTRRAPSVLREFFMKIVLLVIAAVVRRSVGVAQRVGSDAGRGREQVESTSTTIRDRQHHPWDKHDHPWDIRGKHDIRRGTDRGRLHREVSHA